MNYKALIESFNKTYLYYRRRYVIMTTKTTETVKHGYSDKTVMSHLDGRYALAVFSGDKATRFLSVDVDAGGKKAARQVIDAFIAMGIPAELIYVSISGKKGYHVDIFFDPFIYNSQAKNLYELMIWRTGLDPRKVEYRPTPTQAIKIPLGIHAQTGMRCWFADRETLEPIEDMEYILGIQFLAAERICSILKEQNKRRWNELYAEMVCEGTGQDTSITREIEFNDDYYESHRLTRTGTRHDTMLRIACDMRSYGAKRGQIEKALKGFYYRQDPWTIESTEKEVLDDIEDIAIWAEENVRVRRYRPSPNGERRPIRFTKEDIGGILAAPTSASRRIALLLFAYIKLFGSAHVSYNTIAETVGCSLATVKTAISELCKRRIVGRQSGGCMVRNGALHRKSNTYYMPDPKPWEMPPDEAIAADSHEYTGVVGADTLDEIYYGTLAGICKPWYLERFLTKPEMERVKAYGRESASRCG